ncbi:MAG: hypothetical protein K0R68_49 [Mycobacterium sp.]|nr:hypothetical protein [Mycobacterium sp.]
MAIVRTVVSGGLIAAASAALLSGCASGEDLMTSVAPPRSNAPAASGHNGSDAATLPSAPNANDLAVTPRQGEYLQALSAQGVRRSNDLMALSIGSYVCQARNAGQTDQGVWDFVFPLVRGEIHDMNPNTAVTAIAAQVDETTAQYIRVATDHLC